MAKVYCFNYYFLNNNIKQMSFYTKLINIHILKIVQLKRISNNIKICTYNNSLFLNLLRRF